MPTDWVDSCGLADSALNNGGKIAFTSSPMSISCGLSCAGVAENGLTLIEPPMLNCGASWGLDDKALSTIGAIALTRSPTSKPCGCTAPGPAENGLMLIPPPML